MLALWQGNLFARDYSPTSVVDCVSNKRGEMFFFLISVFVFYRCLFLFINFFCVFSSKYTFFSCRLKGVWEGKYYKQLFDNGACETTLSAFYIFKLIDTHQQLNTF
jgi:hypothetical protein